MNPLLLGFQESAEIVPSLIGALQRTGMIMGVSLRLHYLITGETLALSGKTGTVTGTIDDKAAFGTIVVGGAEWPFSARGVVAPAGLYEGRGLLRGVAARVGWIVEEDGTVTGVMTAGGESSRAPALDPDAPDATTIEGRPVAVSAITGDATVVRR